MKRCIFIIEDKLTDISGCLLTLQTILNAGIKKRQEDEWKDIRLCLLHVFEDGKTQSDYKSRFLNAFQHSKEIMKENKLYSFDCVDYIAISLKKEDYASGEVDKLAKEIIARQRKYLKDCDFTPEFVRNFPAVSGNEAAYVLLMDIILVPGENVDQERVQDQKPVLSSCLYAKFPKGHCITYTNYSEYYGDKWAVLAGITSQEVPIERERLTRARAIYIPLKDRLYRALDI